MIHQVQSARFTVVCLTTSGLLTVQLAIAMPSQASVRSIATGEQRACAENALNLSINAEKVACPLSKKGSNRSDAPPLGSR